MNFVENIVESFTSGGGSGGVRQEEVVQQRTDYYASGPAPTSNGPPPVPRPWVARWADQQQAWFYINEETGERTWEVPYGGSGGGGGYGGGYDGGAAGGYSSGGQRGYQDQVVYQQDTTTYVQEAPRKNHALAYGALGLAAGVAGGAFLGYEGNKIHNEWDGEKDRIEQDVEDFPENAANWTGEKVGEAEYDVDKVENDVTNFPENAAQWVGDKVGGVERFGDEIDDAYDAGRAEGQDGW